MWYRSALLALRLSVEPVEGRSHTAKYNNCNVNRIHVKTAVVMKQMCLPLGSRTLDTQFVEIVFIF